MRQLSPTGKQAINDRAQRHGFSSDAVLSMLQSVIDGRGSMAQFSHPEFEGSDQWMRGCMIMVSVMFNSLLKGRIDALCIELLGLVANQPDLIAGGSSQSQSQGSQQQRGSGPAGPVSLFVPPTGGGSGNWRPEDLGWASRTRKACRTPRQGNSEQRGICQQEGGVAESALGPGIALAVLRLVLCRVAQSLPPWGGLLYIQPAAAFAQPSAASTASDRSA